MATRIAQSTLVALLLVACTKWQTIYIYNNSDKDVMRHPIIGTLQPGETAEVSFETIWRVSGDAGPTDCGTQDLKAFFDASNGENWRAYLDLGWRESWIEARRYMLQLEPDFTMYIVNPDDRDDMPVSVFPEQPIGLPLTLSSCNES